MTFTDYIETSTTSFRKKWLEDIISNYRKRIELHLEGNRDRALEKELSKKQDTIMNTEDTLERFMNGILKENMIAQAIFEPNTRNVPKDKMLLEYLKSKKVFLNIIPNEGQSSYFGEHKQIKKIKLDNFEIISAIWSSKSNDAGVSSKISKISKKVFKNKTILIADGPKIRKEHLDKLKNVNNLQVMNVEKFIEFYNKRSNVD